MKNRHDSEGRRAGCAPVSDKKGDTVATVMEENGKSCASPRRNKRGSRRRRLQKSTSDPRDEERLCDPTVDHDREDEIAVGMKIALRGYCMIVQTDDQGRRAFSVKPIQIGG